MNKDAINAAAGNKPITDRKSVSPKTGEDVCIAALSGSVSAAYTNFDEAVSAWNLAGAGAVLTLCADVVTARAITVSEGSADAPMVLELNGHKIERRLTSAAADGCVVIVRDGAYMEISDSSAEGTGVLTGGSNLNGGGGIRVRGTLRMTGGAIRGNKTAVVGGGVFICPGGTFSLSGGEISGNTAGSDGGGVYNAGIFSVSGSVIGGNEARFSGGGVFNSGTVSAADAEIIGNKAGTFGGGICNNHGEFAMNGGKVSGNAAGCCSGGVENYAAFAISGMLTIRDNTASLGRTSNVCLPLSRYSLKIAGEMTGGFVGVSCASSGAGTVFAEICSDAARNGRPADIFKADDDSYRIAEEDSALVLIDKD